MVDELCATASFPPPRRKFLVKYTEKKWEGESVYLLEPLTYMNQSGPAVREFLGYFGGADLDLKHSLEDSLLVVHDDLDLEEGKLRFRASGSSGGHRGVQSLIEALGSNTFGRLKVGIGRRHGSEAREYVLEKLSSAEEESFLAICRQAARTLPVWIREGSRACANQFNGGKPRNESSESV